MAQPQIRTLLIEDNPADARLLAIRLNEVPNHGVDVTRASRLTEGMRRLETEPFDLVLLDLSLPDSKGPATLDLVHAKFPNVPILLLTGFADVDYARAALRSGARDYLVKGSFDGRVLLQSMHHAIERQRMHTRLERNGEVARSGA